MNAATLRIAPVVFGALLTLAWAGAGDSYPPDEIDGLAAWYTVDSLHRKMTNGDSVTAWPDSSGNGHDLSTDSKIPPALFQTLQLNGKPIVQIRRHNSFAVNEPFELNDHTIFLVYEARFKDRALFKSDADHGEGLVLREADKQHLYRTGEKGEAVFAYTRTQELGGEFGITVLGRQDGVLRAFINGRDVSSGSRFADPIRVGTFFAIRYTKFVDGDGNGLKIAEMAFYDRFLTGAERDGVPRHLPELYGLRIPDPGETSLEDRLTEARGSDAPTASLSTTTGVNVNEAAGVAIEWDKTVKVDAPFRHGGSKEPSRLYSTRDRARVGIFLSIPFRSEASGVNIRVLLLKNGEEYQTREAQTGVFDEGSIGNLGLQATVILDAGDYVEVIAVAAGAAGKVYVVPDQAVFLAEAN